MKTIYIPVSDRPECVIALDQGFKLGEQIRANVIGYHIRSHSDSTVELPDEAKSSTLDVHTYDAAWENLLAQKRTNNDHVKAKLLFDKMAELFGYQLSKKPQKEPSAFWSENVGSPEHLFSIMGPVADLIMISRPASKGASIARSIMQSAVLNSASPVLILPQTKVKPIGHRIAIAWNQSTEASLAVKAAMPLLQMATEVNIITTGTENKLGPKASHLVNYLKLWEVKAKHIKVNGKSDTDALLNGYKQSHSDLLVMGAYSRSRLRQQIFGGVTQYMLHEAKIPVLMLHT
ncbi:universal stress protein [Marinicella litoralis]|uniref:Universal stress protein family protein n=1 Tax=Marinicella litoralis TaxID=644220 RepID=A0A4R6XK68_9GAMM|nr:universal stress protein [Marinicella litoralis]TDR18274.1 universal stress protein family protein [Marinicella litoralis]